MVVQFVTARRRRQRCDNRQTRVAVGTMLVLAFMPLAAPAPSALAAAADWPKVLDNAPKGVQAFVATTSFSSLNKHWSQFAAAIGISDTLPVGPMDALSSVGLDVTNIDRERGMGLALMQGDYQSDTPPVIFMLPVTDYAKWLASVDSTAKPEGVAEVKLGSKEEPAFVRSAGNWALISPSKDAISNYVRDETISAQYKSDIGNAGRDLVDRCDVFALIDTQALAGMKDTFIHTMTDQITSQMAMMSQMGIGPAGGAAAMTPEQIKAINEAVINMIFKDTSGMAAGLRFSDRGVAVDFAVQTATGSEISSFLPGTENPRNLLSHLNDAPFILAMSMDLKAVKVAPLLETIEKQLGLEAIMHPDSSSGSTGTANPMGLSPTLKMLEKSDGFAVAVYANPGGITGGVFSQMVNFISGESADLSTAEKSIIESMNGQSQSGIEFTTEYADGAQDIGGVKADTYAIKMKFPAEMMQEQQMASMLYGPFGVRGFIAPVKGGVVQTVSRNSTLVESALAVANGEKPGMDANKTLAAVDALLPDSPAIRAYLGIGPISEMVAPMAAMFLPGVNFDDLKTLPPLVAGAAVKAGGITGTLAIPAPVLKEGFQLVKQARAQMMNNNNNNNGGNGQGDEPPIF